LFLEDRLTFVSSISIVKAQSPFQMKKILPLLLCLYGSIIKSQAPQMLYGLATKSSPSSVFLATANPLTGSVTNISTSSLAANFLVGTGMIDPLNNTFYFTSSNNVIAAVSMTSGNLISTVTMSNANAPNFSGYMFNCADSKIYGVASSSSPQAVYVASLNASTGSVTNITPSLGGYFQSGCGTIDTRHNIFYLTAGNGSFVGVSLPTGSVVTNAPINNPNASWFSYYKYNPVDSTIYGLAGKNSPNSVWLAKMNPQTGLVTIISQNTVAAVVSMGRSELDRTNQIFYFGDGTFNIIGVSLSTGNVISSQTMTNTNAISFNNFTYAPDCSEIPTGIDQKNMSSSILLFPNPARKNIFVRNAENRSLKIQLLNQLGSAVLSASGENINMNLETLAPGIYYLKISGKGINETKKLVIEN
jgi:hypothetical protein